MQIIRLAHIFISSYFQIFTLVFVEALIFWSFFIPSASSGRRRQKDGDDLRHLSYSLLLKLYNCIPYFSFPGGQKKSSQRKGLGKPAIIPLPELLRKPAACATLAIWDNIFAAFSQVMPRPNGGLLGANLTCEVSLAACFLEF